VRRTLAGLLFEPSDNQLVGQRRIACDTTAKPASSSAAVSEVDGEVAHALADQACHGRGAFSVQLSPRRRTI